MSRAGKPTDNPVNESLNGWIKEELFVDFNLGRSRNVAETIMDYVNYYNKKRPAYSLGYLTPALFLQKFRSGEIEHKDTFSKRKLSEIPKFVREKMVAKIQEEKETQEIASWFNKKAKGPSKEEALETFLVATSLTSTKALS